MSEADTIDRIRSRAPMYVGEVDASGLHHLLWEVLGNAVDEHLAGFCRRIDITLHDDGSVSVEDDGRGISVEPLANGTPLLVEVLTRFHDRATFDGHPRHVHLDGVGVGLVVVNALSRRALVETTRGGRRYQIELHQGVAGPLVDLGPTERKGTRFTFVPDPLIFPRVDFDATRIREGLLPIAAFCPHLAICFADERRTVFSCPEGIVALLTRERVTNTVIPTVPLHAMGEQDGIRVEVAMQWASNREGRVRGFRHGPAPRPEAGQSDARRAHEPRSAPARRGVVRRCLSEFAEQRPEEVRRLLHACDSDR